MYHIDKAFCFDAKAGTRKQGDVIELEGNEKDFALENKCVTRIKEDQPVKKVKK